MADEDFGVRCDSRGLTLPWTVRSSAGISSILKESVARRKFESTVRAQVSTVHQSNALNGTYPEPGRPLGNQK